MVRHAHTKGASAPGMNITDEHKDKDGDFSFTAESNGWEIYAKSSGCVEFSRPYDEESVHVCTLSDFMAAVTEAASEMKLRDYEVD